MGFEIVSEMVAPNVLGRSERRVRMVCGLCDIAVYLAVSPADQSDRVIASVQAGHARCRCEHDA